MRHQMGWAEHLATRADEVLTGRQASPDPERGMVAVSPVEEPAETEDGEPARVDRRPVLLWERQWRDGGDVWTVVPLTGPRSSSPLALVDHVQQLDGARLAGLRLSPVLVRLHPSAVRRSAIVGVVSQRDLDAVEDALAIGAIRDLTTETGDTAVSFRDVLDGGLWSPDADLLDLRRRADAVRDPSAVPPPPVMTPAPIIPPSPWQLTRQRAESRRAKRRRPNHRLRHDNT